MDIDSVWSSAMRSLLLCFELMMSVTSMTTNQCTDGPTNARDNNKKGHVATVHFCSSVRYKYTMMSDSTQSSNAERSISFHGPSQESRPNPRVHIRCTHCGVLSSLFVVCLVLATMDGSCDGRKARSYKDPIHAQNVNRTRSSLPGGEFLY
jgi:hypothetical protein